MNNSNIMNSNFQTIPESEIQFFKEKVKHWLNVDEQIDGLQKQIKELKKVRDKELEPGITKFMTPIEANQYQSFEKASILIFFI